jgi:Protein of unknown function (DUF3352)
MSPRLAPAALAFAIALLGAGCGEDEEAGSGAASAIPPDPVLYLEADISGEGEQHSNLDAILGELGELPLLGTPVDPKTFIADALEDLGRENGIDISYEEDFEPWLGDTLAVGYTSLAEGEESFVLSIAVDDEEIARDSVARITAADAASETEADYDGVTYLRSGSGEYSLGVFDDKFVLATPEEFEAAVDASRGESIATDDDVNDALEVLPDDRLGTLYLDTGAALDLAVQEGDAEAAEVETARTLAPELLEQPLAASLSAGERTVALDVAVGHSEDGPQVSATDRLADAPGDAFAAVGIAGLGDQIEPIVSRVQAIASEFESATGVPLDDVLASAEDAVAYIRGDLNDGAMATLDVELVPGGDAPELLLEGLEQLAREQVDSRVGPPLDEGESGFSAEFSTPDSGPLTVINVQLEDDELSLSYATPPEAANQPPVDETLGESEVFQAAASSLGDDYEMVGFADLGPILDAAVGDSSLLDLATGAATPEQAIAGFLADKLGFAALGVRTDGDQIVQRVLVGLD